MTSQKNLAGEFTRPNVLTDIELKYLTMIAEGNHPSNIARTDDTSEVKVHGILNSARDKLGATNLLNAVSIALLKGVILREI
jgi:DNA-binding CsgD family transcriptional regulator